MLMLLNSLPIKKKKNIFAFFPPQVIDTQENKDRRFHLHQNMG